MRFKHLLMRMVGALATIVLCQTTMAQPHGLWNFGSGNLSATVGSDLTYLDGVGGATDTADAFGTTTSFGIPDIGGTPANVIRVPASLDGMGYVMSNPAANGSGTLVNDYTIIFDVLYPAASAGIVRPLLEPDDGSFTGTMTYFGVGANNGLGAFGSDGLNGPFDGQLAADTWYRVGIVVDDAGNRVRKYINGLQVGDFAKGGPDSRYTLDPTVPAVLFANHLAMGGTNAIGYVNSVQLRTEALSVFQMAAMGGPSATGIPQVVPPIPSFLVSFRPRGAFSGRDTSFGAVIESGDTTIMDASISLVLDGTPLTAPTITRNGTRITVSKPSAGLLTLGNHSLVVNYTDSTDGAKSFTNNFKAVVMFEDFEDIVLNANVHEGLAGAMVWTNRPPGTWTVDNTGRSPNDPGSPGSMLDAIADLDQGVTEWEGWGFANKDWWVATAGDQQRSFFTRGIGTVAIVDPDEWDDRGDPESLYEYNSALVSPAVSLAGVAPGTLFVRFDSSMRNEPIQIITVSVSFDGGAETELLRWDGNVGAGEPGFKADAENEEVVIEIDNPDGASTVQLRFAMIQADNDWWWAIDNITLDSGVPAPTITAQPTGLHVSEGADVSFTVGGGGSLLSYQWRKDGVNLTTPSATTATLVIDDATAADAGNYDAVVSNSGGSVTSSAAALSTFGGVITDDLVAHLKFDSDANDATGRGNNGTLRAQDGGLYPGFDVLPTYVSGGSQLIGTDALNITTGGYVNLGQPADLRFGTDTDFSFSFWVKAADASAWTGDPSFLGTKSWTSGGNPGFVVAAQGSGGWKWNYASPPSGRKDSPNFAASGGVVADGGWHNVLVTHDRTGVATFYTDGQLLGTASIADGGDIDALDVNLGNDGTGAYGFASDTGARFVNISMDDVGFWRRQLTVQEANAIHLAGRAGNDLSQAAVSFGVPPIITANPQTQFVSAGGNVTFSVGIDVTSSPPLTYQWQKDMANIMGATASTLTLNSVMGGDSGNYRVVVSNNDGMATSSEATLTVFSGQLGDDLVAHLQFENNLNDSSGRGNNGTSVGSTPYVAGVIGQGLSYSSAADGSSFNYVSLGAPADLNFGTGTDFAVAFWTKFSTWTGDPAFIANKSWNSGGNPGYIIATGSNGRMQWNVAGPPGGRKDYDGPADTLSGGAWHHVVVSFDRDGVASSYIDGVLANRSGNTADNDVDTPAGQATNIGQDGTGAYTDGGSVGISDANIDDVGIWRRQLSPQEVAAIHSAGLNGVSIGQAGRPIITAQPQAATTLARCGVQFSVSVTGLSPFTYQWKKNGAAIAGATTATLVIADPNAADAGNYSVDVSNSGGTVSSASAALTVNSATVLGQWDFNAGNLVATIGNDLTYFDADVSRDTTFGSTTSYGIPDIGGTSVNVMFMDPQAPTITGGWGGYVMAHGAAPNGGGGFVNCYTLVYDVLFPLAANGTWRSFFQTSQANSNDGELFVNPANGIGISGDYEGTIIADTWHRVVFVVNTGAGTVFKYIDGVLVGTTGIGGVDGRFSLDPTALLFGDESGAGEVNDTYVSSVQFLEGGLTDAEVAALGGASANKIGMPLRITRIRQTASVTIDWVGGNAPYTLQTRASLSSGDWADVLTTNDQTATVPSDAAQGFFRVVSRLTLQATLTGAAERPNPVASAATGSALVHVDGHTVTVDGTFQGLGSNANNCHIHGPASTEEAAGVIQGLMFTAGASGTITGGGVLSPANLAHLLNGMTYINLHSVNNGGGEIRGQIVP